MTMKATPHWKEMQQYIIDDGDDWALRDDAPEDFKKEFDEFQKEFDEAAKKGIAL